MRAAGRGALLAGGAAGVLVLVSGGAALTAGAAVPPTSAGKTSESWPAYAFGAPTYSGVSPVTAVFTVTSTPASTPARVRAKFQTVPTWSECTRSGTTTTWTCTLDGTTLSGALQRFAVP